MSIQPGEPDHEVLGEVPLDLEELAAIDDTGDDLVHLVRLVRVLGDDRVQFSIHPVRIVGARRGRRIVLIVLRKVGEQAPDEVEGVGIVLGDEMCHPAPGGVDLGPAQFVERHVLGGDGLDDLGPGDEHVARPANHHREVGDRGRIDGAAGARPHDRRDLRDDPAGQGVPEEDLGVPAEAHHAFLDPRPPGIVEPDHRGAVSQREIQDLADLLRVSLPQRAAEDREVLREDIHQPRVDRPVAGHHAIRRSVDFVHAERGGPMGDEPIEFDERPGVEQVGDSLAGGQFPSGVLAGDARGTAPLLDAGAAGGQFTLPAGGAVRVERTVRHAAVSPPRMWSAAGSR